MPLFYPEELDSVAHSHHFEQSFSFADYPGPVSIGLIPVGSNILKTFIEVISVFDAGVQVTVGDSVAMARLMAVGDSRLTRAVTYEADSGYTYTSDTAVNLYFVGVVPTMGTGRVVVYYL